MGDVAVWTDDLAVQTDDVAADWMGHGGGTLQTWRADVAGVVAGGQRVVNRRQFVVISDCPSYGSGIVRGPPDKAWARRVAPP